MKSRVSRARARLSAMLAVPEQYGGSNIAGLRTIAPANNHTPPPFASNNAATAH
jgi:hypothetical protein